VTTRPNGSLVSRRRWALVLGVVVLSVGAVLAAVMLPIIGGSPPEPQIEAAGAGPVRDAEPAPTLTFARFDGSTASVEDYRGRPLVLNFWASWCPPCVAEMRDIFEPAHQRYGDRVAFLGAAMQDTREAADRTVTATGVTYDLADDPDGALFRAFGGLGMPTTVFVSADGLVIGRHTGALTAGQLEQAIEQLLALQ
jgi:cytochrome c biogenesis protein CcmG/thiol:disulfide interchange protein DsbE